MSNDPAFSTMRSCALNWTRSVNMLRTMLDTEPSSVSTSHSAKTTATGVTSPVQSPPPDAASTTPSTITFVM
ncbi:MAG: hypothetical protein J4F38_11935 [Pseudomonadales bacterium]|nr:hypothetical protein [Pseudomonadales bacterium]